VGEVSGGVGKTYVRSRLGFVGGLGKVWSFVVVFPQLTVLVETSEEVVTVQSATALCVAASIRANAPLVTAIPADTFDRRPLVRVRLESLSVIGLGP
jgi:hypothetical protein